MNNLVFVNSFCWAYITISGAVLWLINWFIYSKKLMIFWVSLWIIVEIYIGIILFQTCREITKMIAG